jgi:HK97 family phage major capsid protein
VRTIREQIEAGEAKRAASVARMKEISDGSFGEGRKMDETEAQEFDGLSTEAKGILADIGRLKELEGVMRDTATPVSAAAATSPDAGTATRNEGPATSPVVTWGKSNLPPGVRFTRYACCIGAAKGNIMQAEQMSRRFTDTPEVNLALKAAVAAGTTQDATWASPLVQLQEMQSEFVDFLRPRTILGRIPNLRRVPFNIKFTRQTAGTTGTFVGEGLPKPLGKMDFELLSLTWAKAATIIVMTEELVRFSNPGSEVLARDDLAAGIARYLDVRFIDPVYAGVANVSPASITNGITPIASLGTTVALITDSAALALAEMIEADIDTTNLVWIMNPSTALSLSLKRTSQDIFAFPNITAQGGTFLGYPVITSNSVALSGSPTESFVVLMDPTNIMLADDGAVSIDMSTEASLQMDNAPSAGAQSLVSLWQNNLVALRAERFINWRRRRETAVQVITMNAKW